MVGVGADKMPAVTVGEIPAEPPSDGTLFLLDVREPEEWAAGHIAGAVHIPMGELTSRLEEVPRTTRVVAVCRSGHRSAAVTSYLVRGGWDAHNLTGGMMAWAAVGRSMVSDGAAPPAVL
jgi:rhodanese-related sulfurtransferase